MFVILLFATIIATVGWSYAKYRSEENVGNFDLIVEPVQMPHAVYSENDKSLTFYYGYTPAVGDTYNGKSVTKVYYDNIDTTKYHCLIEFTGAFSSSTNLPEWTELADSVKSVSFDASFKDVTPVSTSAWFFNFNNATTIDLTNLNTSNVTNMAYMFYKCTNVQSLDLGSFDTKKVTNMRDMFFSCNSLTELNISQFDTSEVTTMKEMFNGCQSITTLNLNHFTTKKVTTMQGMFYGCKALTSLLVSNFNTEQVTNMQQMFMYNEKLTILDLSSFVTPKVTTMSQMFDDCLSLTNLNISNFNTSNVTTMYYMFKSCHALSSLDLSSFNTKKVTNMEKMFYECHVLKTIYVSDDFVLNKNLSAKNMFNSPAELNLGLVLEGGSGTKWTDMQTSDPNNYMSKKYAVIDGANGQPGYFTLKDSATPSPATLNVTVDTGVAAGYTVPTWNYQNKDTVITLNAPVDGVTEVVLTCGEKTKKATITNGTITIPAEFVTDGATITISVAT